MMKFTAVFRLAVHGSGDKFYDRCAWTHYIIVIDYAITCTCMTVLDVWSIQQISVENW